MEFYQPVPITVKDQDDLLSYRERSEKTQTSPFHSINFALLSWEKEHEQNSGAVHRGQPGPVGQDRHVPRVTHIKVPGIVLGSSSLFCPSCPLWLHDMHSKNFSEGQ